MATPRMTPDSSLTSDSWNFVLNVSLALRGRFMVSTLSVLRGLSRGSLRPQPARPVQCGARVDEGAEVDGHAELLRQGPLAPEGVVAAGLDETHHLPRVIQHGAPGGAGVSPPVDGHVPVRVRVHVPAAQ